MFILNFTFLISLSITSSLNNKPIDWVKFNDNRPISEAQWEIKLEVCSILDYKEMNPTRLKMDDLLNDWKTNEEIEVESFLNKVKEVKEFSWLERGQQEFILKILTDAFKTKLETPSFKIPNSLILAQAILESWWWKSQYMMERNNPFWIYFKNKWKLRLKPFWTLEEAIRYYIQNLENSPFYVWLQKKLEKNSDSLTLISHLGSYSEDEGYEYKLKEIILSFSLKSYDDI